MPFTVTGEDGDDLPADLAAYLGAKIAEMEADPVFQELTQGKFVEFEVYGYCGDGNTPAR